MREAAFSYPRFSLVCHRRHFRRADARPRRCRDRRLCEPRLMDVVAATSLLAVIAALMLWPPGNSRQAFGAL